jgi:mono/diheme cytochrome c family protein
MVRWAATVLLALGLAGCGSLGLHGPHAPSAAERGHATARQICAACHEVEPGKAGSRGAAPAFASREMQHLSGLDGRIETLTRLGHHAMPPQHLTAEQVTDLVAYIDSLKPTGGEPTLDQRGQARPKG